ncbi:hypothetical protein V6N13_121064 [Hibiscus sabdariffa]
MSWDLDMCEKRCYGILACVRVDAMGSWHVRKRMSWDLDISNLCISGLGYRYQNGGIGTDSSLEFEYRCSPTGTGTISLRYRYLCMDIGTVRQRYRYLVWGTGTV